jgi:hypothetical protein
MRQQFETDIGELSDPIREDFRRVRSRFLRIAADTRSAVVVDTGTDTALDMAWDCVDQLTHTFGTPQRVTS